MRYANADHGKVPFAAFVDPTRFVGVVIYDTSQAVARAAGRAAGRAFGSIVTGMKARRTANEVSRLSDDVLRDIGIDRAEIGTLARRVAEHPDIDYRTLRVRRTLG